MVVLSLTDKPYHEKSHSHNSYEKTWLAPSFFYIFVTKINKTKTPPAAAKYFFQTTSFFTLDFNPRYKNIGIAIIKHRVIISDKLVPPQFLILDT